MTALCGVVLPLSLASCTTTAQKNDRITTGSIPTQSLNFANRWNR